MPKETQIMTSYIVAVHLIIEADANPGTEIGGVLDAMLTQNMRKYLGAHSALIDWAVAGPDMASSIALVDLSNAYTPDESRFPDWPASRHLRQGRLRTAMS